MLQLLLERGADPNRARTDGYTPLFYAAEVGASAGSTAVMAALLGAGADPNARASGVSQDTLPSPFPVGSLTKH